MKFNFRSNRRVHKPSEEAPKGNDAGGYVEENDFDDHLAVTNLNVAGEEGDELDCAKQRRDGDVANPTHVCAIHIFVHLSLRAQRTASKRHDEHELEVRGVTLHPILRGEARYRFVRNAESSANESTNALELHRRRTVDAQSSNDAHSSVEVVPEFERYAGPRHAAVHLVRCSPLHRALETREACVEIRCSFATIRIDEAPQREAIDLEISRRCRFVPALSQLAHLGELILVTLVVCEVERLEMIHEFANCMLPFSFQSKRNSMSLPPSALDRVLGFLPPQAATAAAPPAPPLATAARAAAPVESSSQAGPPSALTLSESAALANDNVAHFTRDSFVGDVNGMHVLHEAQLMDVTGQLRVAGMGGALRWEQRGSRGDRMVWIPNGARNTAARGGLRALLDGFEALRAQLASSLPELGLTQRTSVQIACYRGGGERYVRHFDAIRGRDDHGEQRRVTALYYTSHAWFAAHGGALRLFAPGGEAVELAPLLDRLVLFRSEIVEHEVLAAHAPRYAVTCWMYGKPCSVAAPSPQPLLASPPAALVAASVAAKKIGERPPTSTTVLAGGGEEEALPTIFVSIVSYRDPQCAATIRDLFETASSPDRVFVGVVFQNHATEDAECFASYVGAPCPRPAQVREMHCDYRAAKGPTWARHRVAQLYRGEDYVLQIDSHMRFREGWDTYLLDQLAACPSPRALLTAYPPGFTLPYAGPPADDRPTLLCAKSIDEDGMLRIAGKRLAKASPTPTPSLFWAAGFNFCPAQAMLDVPYDAKTPHLFFGEEIGMAARLWTSGWDFFTPGRSVVFHLWTRDHRPTFRELRSATTEAEQRASLARVHRLLQLDAGEEDDAMIDFGPYGLGAQRTLAEFEAFIGVEPRTRALTERARLGGQRSDAFYRDAAAEVLRLMGIAM